MEKAELGSRILEIWQMNKRNRKSYPVIAFCEYQLFILLSASGQPEPKRIWELRLHSALVFPLKPASCAMYTHNRFSAGGATRLRFQPLRPLLLLSPALPQGGISSCLDSNCPLLFFHHPIADASPHYLRSVLSQRHYQISAKTVIIMCAWFISPGTLLQRGHVSLHDAANK